MIGTSSKSPSHHRLLAQRLQSRLRDLDSQSQLRNVTELRGVNLCSNDYLGLSRDIRLKRALLKGIEKSAGLASTGSRLLGGHYAIWDEVEAEFAAFAGTESALYFSSGFAANTGLLGAILGRDDLVFSDALNHASIVDGIRLGRARKIIYPHADLNWLERELRHHGEFAGGKVIVTESIFSMDGDRAPLRELFALAQKYGAEVIVDEAHATATYGPGGRGLVGELGLEQQALAIVHTCGKALASMGGFVCGSGVLKRFLINHARSFIFSTALPPYVGHQVQAALRLASAMDQERDYLASLAAKLRQRLRSLGFDLDASGTHIVPLVLGGNVEALRFAELLAQQSFGVRAIRPPSVPPGTARLRLSLTARITEEEIERFVTAVASLTAGNTHLLR